MNRSPLRAFLLIPFALACFALSPQARAVCQEGCLTNQNTVLGEDALLSNTTGHNNTATGFNALLNNTTGFGNTAHGWGALYSNTTSGGNTANGVEALYSTTIGGHNTASGFQALFHNTTGSQNIATGSFALYQNTGGSANTAYGSDALYGNTTGINNTATGMFALYSNTTGNGNKAYGNWALLNNTTGSDNTAVGDSALYSNTTGNTNIALGSNAGTNLTTGSNNIDIGNQGVAGESGIIRIGTPGMQTATHIAGIRGATAAGGIAVYVRTNGKLGTNTSSQRFKEEIRPMDRESEVILALNPVTFRYKADLDPDGMPQFGLVAEEVDKVAPGLVARDENGEPYTVRYEAVNAMLLNEFLKEHHRVETLEATVSKLQAQGKEIAELKVALKQQAAQLQKVSAWLEANMPATRLVDNE
jgi:hypothetical protein